MNIFPLFTILLKFRSSSSIYFQRNNQMITAYNLTKKAMFVDRLPEKHICHQAGCLYIITSDFMHSDQLNYNSNYTIYESAQYNINVHIMS